MLWRWKYAVYCGLAQLADDDTITDEPRGVEPQALKDQAEARSNEWPQRAGCGQHGVGVRQSPWRDLDPVACRAWIHHVTSSADLVIDCLGVMHEPDQRGAFELRAQVTKPDGVLLLQYHSLVAIVTHGQWNALRHGHFAYYSLTSLMRLLDAVGLRVVTAWEFELYGGTVLVAAVPADVQPDESVRRILVAEDALGITDPTRWRVFRTVRTRISGL